MSTSDSDRPRTSRSDMTLEAEQRPASQPYPGRPGTVGDTFGPVAHEPVADRTDHRARMAVQVSTPHHDRVRWGSVWAGLIVALPTFVLLELAFFALGWLTFDQNQPGTTAGWSSGLIGLFAFFLGGLTAGATAVWRGSSEGLLHGILVWALGAVSIIFLTLFGGGALFGSLAQVFTQVASLQQGGLPEVQSAQALDTARSAAGWALLGLGLSVVAAAVGGLAGVKLWPRVGDTGPDTRIDMQ